MASAGHRHAVSSHPWDWGGSDEAVRRGVEDANYAVQQLGITNEERARYSSPVDEAVGLRHLRHLGEGLRMLEDGMTPTEAKELIRELSSDSDFRAKLFGGDVRSKKIWAGLNARAHYTRTPDEAA